ncbi:MAG TPA: OB-fold domain-containing protein [Acidimicrobiales bacterium]|nr:OB-fold domain-containing protein [Acidimicrobiales bacterium]
MTELARGPAFRLLPRLEEDNRFFWTSGADGRLRFLRCRHCSYYVHPPAPRCPECLSEDVAPEPVSGRATLVAHTCNMQQWIPGSEPYLIGLVAIDEQESVRLTTNLVDVSIEEVRTGMALEVLFEHHDDVFLPLFRPVAG